MGRRPRLARPAYLLPPAQQHAHQLRGNRRRAMPEGVVRLQLCGRRRPALRPLRSRPRRRHQESDRVDLAVALRCSITPDEGGEVSGGGEEAAPPSGTRGHAAAGGTAGGRHWTRTPVEPRRRHRRGVGLRVRRRRRPAPDLPKVRGPPSLRRSPTAGAPQWVRWSGAQVLPGSPPNADGVKTPARGQIARARSRAKRSPV